MIRFDDNYNNNNNNNTMKGLEMTQTFNRETAPMEIEINGTAVTFEVKDEKPMTTSLDIARVFEKRHDNVLRAIEAKMHTVEGLLNFEESSYINAQGKEQPMYLLDRDFFSFIVMGFTGSKADKWKLDYIKAFNKLEEHYRNGIGAINTGNPFIDALVATQLEMNGLTQRIEKLEKRKVGTVLRPPKGYTSIAKLADITGFSENFVRKHLIRLAKPDIAKASLQLETGEVVPYDAYEVEPVQFWAEEIRNTSELVKEGGSFYWSPITGRNAIFKIRW